MNQGLIQWTQETGIDHSGLHTLLAEEVSRGHGATNHGAVGHDQQVIALAEGFPATDRQGLPTFFHQGHTLARTAGDAEGCRAVVLQAGHHHPLQF